MKRWIKAVVGLPLLSVCLSVVMTECCAAPGTVSEKDVARIKAALPKAARAKPAKPRKVLIFNLCKGFRHGSIPCGAKAFELMGQQTGAYQSASTEDISFFEPDKLKEFDAVILNNTSGELFKGDAEREKRLKESLLSFVKSGKGLVGVHAATDCYYNWPEYGKMIGGYFWGHPWNEKVTVKVDEPDHPLCKAFGEKTFPITEEIYQFRDPYSRKALRVLLSLDVTQTNMNKGGIRRKDKDFAVAWIHTYGQGRVFYCSLGHRNEIFWNPMILQFYLDGIQYALGDIEADAKPSAALSAAAGRPYRFAADPMPTPAPRPARAEAVEPKAAPRPEPPPDDRLMGEYAGSLTADGKASDGLAQVIPEGKGQYRAVLMRGLWGQDKAKKPVRIELTGKAAGNEVALSAMVNNVPWSGKLVGRETLTVQAADGGGRFVGRFTVRTSDTLAAKPPEGAIVLLPFEPGKPPPLAEWTNKNWKPLASGAMEVRRGNTSSVRKFGSCKVHIEFRCPYEPTKRGQGRGNSGVYLQRRYEVQVLDSFGLIPRMGDCGAIYGVSIPKINPSLPPLAWQTYDIEFVASKVGADGKVVRKPMMKAVYHNGIKTHENVALPGHTTAAAASGYTATDALMLQDHGNKVQYRNIWVVELKE